MYLKAPRYFGALFYHHMKKNNRSISKSKYLHGLQCPKYLWYEYHRRSDIPKPSPAVQFAFSEGHRVGELARSLFPDGVLVERDWDPQKHSKKSLAACKLRQPLFEAGFVHGLAYALADILVPVADDQWDLIEVKSSTSVKEEHLLDAAFQKYTYEGAGLKIHKVYIMYLNNEYIRQGEVEADKLLIREDITRQAGVLESKIAEGLEVMAEIIAKDNMPEITIGQHCRSPHDCPLQDICWDFLPQKDNVFILYSGGKKSFDLMERGILNLVDIPADTKLNYKQVIQLEAHKSGKPYLDREAIGEFLSKLEYPLHFIDFETLATAVPLYDGTGPYDYVPFQFSLYIVEQPGAEPIHHDWLAEGRADPRPVFLRQLHTLIADKGSIVAYNAGFEKNCLKNAASVYTDHSKWVRSLNNRFVDLLAPFQKFYYYHPDQAGRASLKNVLPALTKESYAGLGIAEGGTASAEYYRATFDGSVSNNERQKIRADLIKYCDLDTRGMIRIIDALRAAISR